MTPDVRALQTAAIEADARCNLAQREAQWAQERFYAAMAARDRARRALRVATEQMEDA